MYLGHVNEDESGATRRGWAGEGGGRHCAVPPTHLGGTRGGGDTSERGARGAWGKVK